MNRKIIALFIMLALLCLTLTGCTETQKFGNGDPSAEYISMFGNDNTDRLNWTQEQRITWILQAITEQNELSNRIANALANLSERVKVLEKPKAEDHSKCILNLDGKCCTVKGCKVANPDVPVDPCKNTDPRFKKR
jgi:hypothetical protein